MKLKKLKDIISGIYIMLLLHATQNSLNSMKYRVCGSSSKSGSNTKLNPFFEVDVQLSGHEVRLNPSLEVNSKSY
jgi:hypothetical protein